MPLCPGHDGRRNRSGQLDFGRRGDGINPAGSGLQNGVTYYLAAQVKNGLGDYWSDIGISDGITVDLIQPRLAEVPGSRK